VSLLKLTTLERNFINKHKILTSEILDATNMRTKDYKRLMSENRYRVAIGVTACEKKGHRMRGANGHCLICKPANLNYRKRYRESGYVYVAATSDRSDLIKVGYCEDIKKREQSLNVDTYAGYKNWKIYANIGVEQKGAVEHDIHSILKSYSYSTTYIHHGREQLATELFQYSLDEAILLLHRVSGKSPAVPLKMEPYRESSTKKKPESRQTTEVKSKALPNGTSKKTVSEKKVVENSETDVILLNKYQTELQTLKDYYYKLEEQRIRIEAQLEKDNVKQPRLVAKVINSKLIRFLILIAIPYLAWQLYR
jgi:hypothetical protein